MAVVAECDQKLFIGAAKVNRDKSSGLQIIRDEDFALSDRRLVHHLAGRLSVCRVSKCLKHLTNVVDRANCFCSLFTDCEELAIMAECKRGDSFRPFNSRDVPLRLVIQRVYHDIVSAWVANSRIVEKEDTVLDITFESKHELWYG